MQPRLEVRVVPVRLGPNASSRSRPYLLLTSSDLVQLRQTAEAQLPIFYYLRRYHIGGGKAGPVFKACRSWANKCPDSVRWRGCEFKIH